MTVVRRGFLAGTLAVGGLASAGRAFAAGGKGSVLLVIEDDAPPAEAEAVRRLAGPGARMRRLRCGELLDPLDLARQLRVGGFVRLAGLVGGANQILLVEAVRAAHGAVTFDAPHVIAAEFRS